MKKLLALLAVLFLCFGISINQSSAEGDTSFVTREPGLGKQKLDTQDIKYKVSSGLYINFYMDTWYRIPANTVYCLYVSYHGTGDYKPNPMRVQYTDVNHENEEEIVSSFEAGGWVLHTYLENTKNEDIFFRIVDFNFIYSKIKDGNVRGHFMLQEEKDTSTHTFTGYYDYIDPNSGYKAIDEELTYVSLEGSSLTKEKLLTYFKAYDNTLETPSLEITEFTYKDEVGEYKAQIYASDKSGNETSYMIRIIVVKALQATIIGPDQINLEMSEIPNYNINDLLSNFKGSYGLQTAVISMDEDDIEQFYLSLSSPGSVELQIIATFSGGKVTTKTITFNVIDDISPDIYVSQLVLDTTTVNSMSADQIQDYIEARLQSEGATNVNIVSNTYEGNENVEGTYLVEFTYEVDGKVIESSLAINVEKGDVSETSNNDINYLYIVGASALLVVGFTIIKLIRRKKKNTYLS